MPLEDGVNLIGVMDESGTLPEGTFWARWDRNRGRASPGDAPGKPRLEPLPACTVAAVSRFPCLAPADVRVLRAADPDTLADSVKALRNVIVFPRVGEIPEPCKMSGGDLDGDIYLLTWDESLIPEQDAPAVDYKPAQQPQEKEDGVSVRDIVEFQIDYMKNDQVGRIANGHLAIADFATNAHGKRLYANDPKCHQLVHLHSTAVDFAKTGVPVDPAKVHPSRVTPDCTLKLWFITCTLWLFWVFRRQLGTSHQDRFRIGWFGSAMGLLPCNAVDYSDHACTRDPDV